MNLYILILLFILITGLGLLYVSFTKVCKDNVVVKYIPRTFKDEQANPALVSEIFKNDFNGTPLRT